MGGGVHKSPGQDFRSLAFFPTARSVGVIDEIVTVTVDELEKVEPIMESLVVDVHPQVMRAGWTNVKPKGCSPKVLLRTRVEANLNDIAHQVNQLSRVFHAGAIGSVTYPLEGPSRRSRGAIGSLGRPICRC